MSRNRWLLIVLAAFIGWQLFMAWQSPSTRNGGATPGLPEHTVGGTAVPNANPLPTTEDPGRDATHRPGQRTPQAIQGDGLPPEAVATLQRIRDGGPFPYDRDGIVFGNFEGRLPKQTRGYYHEYTVPTPGLNHRGARRIISGGKPPSEFYYTDDHYESFRKIGGAR